MNAREKKHLEKQVARLEDVRAEIYWVFDSLIHKTTNKSKAEAVRIAKIVASLDDALIKAYSEI